MTSTLLYAIIYFVSGKVADAVIAQLVEHFLGKEEVTSSNLVNSSMKSTQFRNFRDGVLFCMI